MSKPKKLEEKLELPETIKVSELSTATKEAIEYFGLDAAGKLNDYACCVEDALIEQVRHSAELKQLIKAMTDRITQLEAYQMNALKVLRDSKLSS